MTCLFCDMHQERCTLMQIASVLWAHATLGKYRAARIQSLARQAAPLITDSSESRTLANIMWALSSLRHSEEEVFAKVVQYSKTRLDSFKQQVRDTFTWHLHCSAYGVVTSPCHS